MINKILGVLGAILGAVLYVLSIKKPKAESAEMAERSKDNFTGLSDADKLRILQRNIKRT